MKEFLCEWRINIEADSPEEAARVAENFMTNRLGSCWHVTDEEGETTAVEIYEEVA